ncbi:MAG TPA: hypothetical protein VFW46_19995 [Stellaceae bacterium]|nr:hypothetical protein [Stellaceae bacterium]
MARLPFLLASSVALGLPAVAAAEDPAYPPIALTLTCGEFRPLLHAQPKAAGTAIIWLDGYYAARNGLSELPSGWIVTVSRGIGAVCARPANAGRTVLDVIAELHRGTKA